VGPLGGDLACWATRGEESAALINGANNFIKQLEELVTPYFCKIPVTAETTPSPDCDPASTLNLVFLASTAMRKALVFFTNYPISGILL
jgi:hypothetical protein